MWALLQEETIQSNLEGLTQSCAWFEAGEKVQTFFWLITIYKHK